MSSKYDIQGIWDYTDNGKNIIEEIYPASKECFNRKKNFKIREDDSKPSCSVFKAKGNSVWLFQDKGGADNKAYNAVQLLAQVKGVDFKEAVKFCYEKYVDNSAVTLSKPDPDPIVEKTDKTFKEIQIGKRLDFTEEMLLLFGPDVKKEHADAFNLYPITHYITQKGYKVSATPDYPIFYYDYVKFGKIYQPFSKEYRFMYVGAKPENQIFADAQTARLLKKVAKTVALLDPEDCESDSDEKFLKDLIICTGPSDAINVYAQGYPVVWLNSETGQFTSYQYNLLKKLVGAPKPEYKQGKIYILPDIDVTGIRMCTKIALQYLDLRIIWLPERLQQYKTDRGKVCKDVRDMFRFYRDDRYDNLSYLFKLLVRTAQPLQFWGRKYDEDGNPTGFDINNECAYKFLRANGFYTTDSKDNKNLFSYIRIKDNVVHEINEKNITKEVNTFIINYFDRNLHYKDISLINTIHRTNQLKAASLEKLGRIKIESVTYGPGFDHIFFRNFSVKVTADAIEEIRWQNFSQLVRSEKIIDMDFHKLDPPFSIEYDPDYQFTLKKSHELSALDPLSKEALEYSRVIRDWNPLTKFVLEIHDKDFSLLKYLFNTGRIHWEKEENEHPLTPKEQWEHNLNFISKVCAIGYALYRYKELSRAWAIYAMESDENIETGKSQGGTGKSFFLSLIKNIRTSIFIDGQKKSLTDDRHIFGGVQEHKTDFVHIDDLGKHVPINTLFVPITGDMTVEPKFVESYPIPFKNSPKIGFTSNHPVKNIDGSMRRRLWFCAFSSYYHPDDPYRNIQERTPRTEFGKDLIQDYTPEEMNKTFNLLAYCLQTYLRFHDKINPPMEGIEKRNMQHSMGDEFVYWAEDYFTDEKINVLIDKKEAFEDYKNTIPDSEKKWLKQNIFKQRLILYAQYSGYTFNPQEMMKSESERKRNDIRGTVDGKDTYYFYFKK